MFLNDYQKDMLKGNMGQLKQTALKNIIRYAEILGAEELCKITKATVYCGKHNYLNAAGEGDFDQIFSRVQLASDEIIHFDETCDTCQVQSCVTPSDDKEFLALNQSEEFFQENQHYVDKAREAGVIIVNSCAPYLNGWLPVMGEHFVTTESGVTIIGNSLWGAMCNSDGIEAAFWSAICGFTPKWGMHVKEKRAGTHLFHIDADLDSILDWDLLGKAVGKRLTSSAIPVITGDFKNVDFNKLRQFLTTLAISSNCELCHIVGYTPEARSIEDAFRGNRVKAEYRISDDDLEYAYNYICDKGAGPVSFVSLGCPHYDIEQIKKTAKYLEGKKVNPGVHFMIWTLYPIKCIAEKNGYLKTIEDAGGHIYTGSCPGTVATCLKGQKGLVFDSFKQTYSTKSSIDVPSYMGDVYNCVDAAVNGHWEESNRWKR